MVDIIIDEEEPEQGGEGDEDMADGEETIGEGGERVVQGKTDVVRCKFCLLSSCGVGVGIALSGQCRAEGRKPSEAIQVNGAALEEIVCI